MTYELETSCISQLINHALMLHNSQSYLFDPWREGLCYYLRAQHQSSAWARQCSQ